MEKWEEAFANATNEEEKAQAAKMRNAIDGPIMCEACYREDTALRITREDIVCVDARNCILQWAPQLVAMVEGFSETHSSH